MSWSVAAIGKPAAALKSLTEQFDRITCTEPEQSIKSLVKTAIEKALAAYPESSAVDVRASGSQSQAYGPDNKLAEGKFTNQLSVEIKPLYGFVA